MPKKKVQDVIDEDNRYGTRPDRTTAETPATGTAMPPRPDFLDEPDMGLTLSEYQQENPMMIGVGQGQETPWWMLDTSYETADPILNGGIANPGDGSWAGLTPEQKQILAGFIPSTDKGDDDDDDDDGKGGGGQLPAYTPTQYSSAWSDRLNAIINDLDLDKFKFDLNGEELYQQYKDQYLRNGRLAMMDTMGQAAGLTGGYGSTYAQNAGQQAYQGYVNDLNNVVPDVYNAAYTRWRDSISDKLRQYELMANADNRDYTRWYNDEKMRYDAYSDAQNLATKERIAQMEADQKAAENERKVYNDTWEAAYKAGTGEAVIGPNGERLFATTGVTKNPDGTYSYTGGTSGGTDIHGLSEKDIADSIDKSLDNLYARGGILGVYGTQMANMARTNPQSVARMLAQKIGQENGWDPTQTSYATSYILALLKEEE